MTCADVLPGDDANPSGTVDPFCMKPNLNFPKPFQSGGAGVLSHEIQRRFNFRELWKEPLLLASAGLGSGQGTSSDVQCDDQVYTTVMVLRLLLSDRGVSGSSAAQGKLL